MSLQAEFTYKQNISTRLSCLVSLGDIYYFIPSCCPDILLGYTVYDGIYVKEKKSELPVIEIFSFAGI